MSIATNLMTAQTPIASSASCGPGQGGMVPIRIRSGILQVLITTGY
jgi:hypothetical protein